MRTLWRRLSPNYDLARPDERVALPRAFGVLALPAALITAVWLLAPRDPAANEPAAVACLAVAGVLCLLFTRADRLSPGQVALLVAANSATIGVGVYFAHAPLSPTPLFFLWAAPMTFALFGLPHAVLQTGVVAVAYAAALVALPGPLPEPGIAAWTGVVVTFLAVGFGVRRLTLRFREVDERFQRAFEDSSVPMALCDVEHRFVRVNDALCEFLGRPRDVLVGTTPLEWTDAADVEATRRYFAAEEPEVIEKRYRRADGAVVWGRVRKSAIRDASGRLAYHQAQIEDVTAQRMADDVRRQAAAALARRARLSDAGAELGRLAVELTDTAELTRRTTELVADCLDARACTVGEYTPDGALRVVASTRPQSVFRPGTVIRLDPGTLAALTLIDREPVAVQDVTTDPRLYTSTVLPGEGVFGALSCALRRPGETLGVITAFTADTRAWAPEDVQFLAVVAAVLSSALQRIRAEAAAHRRAMHDALTDLPNRELFRERLAHALARARRGAAPPAVLLLDLDGFKVVNDSLGHHAGDALLRVIAPRLSEAVRATDIVARLGGDEFVVLADQISDAETALDVAARLERALQQPVRIDETEHHVTASIGIAVATPDSDPDDLLRDADAAMYHAKHRGRGRVELFGEPLRDVAMRRMALEQDLRRALERDELHLEYQPVVDLASGRIVSCEALARWTHPDRGAIRPDEFIGVAEDSGLILPMGRWVLRTACEEAMRWPSHIGLAVNVSGRQVADPDLCRHVHEILVETGLTPDRLTLEITESVLMDEADWAMRTLVGLRAMGIRLALDDFGTGYSSLSYLRRFPLDALKVDRSFVSDLGMDPQASALVEAVVSMARALGLAVVAEGIETEAQRRRIARLGDVYGQGWLFGRPLAATALRERLGAATIAA